MDRLNCSNKLCIRLFNLCKKKHRTILCKYLNSIAEDCNITMDNLSKYYVKQNLTYSMIPLICESINEDLTLFLFTILIYKN